MRERVEDAQHSCLIISLLTNTELTTSRINQHTGDAKMGSKNTSLYKKEPNVTLPPLVAHRRTDLLQAVAGYLEQNVAQVVLSYLSLYCVRDFVLSAQMKKKLQYHFFVNGPTSFVNALVGKKCYQQAVIARLGLDKKVQFFFMNASHEHFSTSDMLYEMEQARTANCLIDVDGQLHHNFRMPGPSAVVCVNPPSSCDGEDLQLTSLREDIPYALVDTKTWEGLENLLEVCVIEHHAWMGKDRHQLLSLPK